MKHSDEGQAYTEIVLETFKLSGLLAVEGDRISAPIGLTSARWKVLGALSGAGAPLTVSQIARTMGQSRQAVQSLVNIMSEAGYIEFQDNPKHKRAKLAALTSEGEDIYQRMMAIQIPWANQCADQIALEDLKTTLKTLKTISELF